MTIMRRQSHKAPASLTGVDRIGTMTLVKFLKAAKEDLERRGLEDEAFRFEMMEEYFRNDFKGSLTYSPSILGM